jgi:hypothetical protein
MSRYLLAAEADQIQDFIFRSSRLREVVGGSQLLSKFCCEVPKKLLELCMGTDDNIVVQDGGAFRVIFSDMAQARQFGNDLAYIYARTLGGNLTVAEPVQVEDGKFAKASELSQEKLREAKNKGHVPAVALHMPHIAWCASCGVSIATKRHKRPKDERENYCCDSCYQRSWNVPPNVPNVILQASLDCFMKQSRM